MISYPRFAELTQPPMIIIEAYSGYCVAVYRCGSILRSDTLRIPAICNGCGDGISEFWVYAFNRKGNRVKSRAIKVVKP